MSFCVSGCLPEISQSRDIESTLGNLIGLGTGRTKKITLGQRVKVITLENDFLFSVCNIYKVQACVVIYRGVTYFTKKSRWS